MPGDRDAFAGEVPTETNKIRNSSRPRPPRGAMTRGFAAVTAFVIAADIMIYSAGEYAGWGAFYLLAPLILLAGRSPRSRRLELFVLLALIAIVGLRLMWLGSIPAIILGAVFIIAFGMALVGLRPFFSEFLSYLAVVLPSGLANVFDFTRRANAHAPRSAETSTVVYPSLAVLGFGSVFVMANPILRDTAGEWLSEAGARLRDFFDLFNGKAFTFWRLLFWTGMTLLAAGILGPWMPRIVLRSFRASKERINARRLSAAPEWSYSAARNTLAAVVVLFSVYLVFEFDFLWFREIPKGFYYPGFYHNPKSIDDLVNFLVQKILDRLGLEVKDPVRWNG